VAEASSVPSVLIVADPQRVGELVTALAEPLPQGAVAVLVSSGGDDTIDLFEAKRPYVVVVTATLDAGDSKSLVEALRDMMPRAEMSIVLVGDLDGPIKTAFDAEDIAPETFVPMPLVARTLRDAVSAGLEAVALVRGGKTEVPADAERPPTDARRSRDAQRARWEALADSFSADLGEDDGAAEEAPALPPPLVIQPRRAEMLPGGLAPPHAWQPGNTADLSDHDKDSDPWSEGPTREPTVIIPDGEPSVPDAASSSPSLTAPTHIPTPAPLPAPEATPPTVSSPSLRAHEWVGGLPLAELLGSDTKRTHPPATDDLGVPLDDFDDDLVLGHGTSRREARIDVLSELAVDEPPSRPSLEAVTAAEDGRDFARQLRAKMSMMAQRLFSGADAAAPAPAVDISPKHDHQTEIDLSALAEEPALDRGVTEIEARVVVRPEEIRALATSPGTWDSQIRERGLPDAGEVVRGLSDAAMLLAKMFAQGSTGRIVFRRDNIEKVVFFDQGRPVFASSSQAHDRMGELLVREGKITAAQYERCQAAGAESGRRMGEILVDFGYLKRRELLPAVRRHVEDIIYSVFGWDRGHYHVIIEEIASGERIRLSRHPASLILEGIRRKLDRSSLDRLIGSPSTVIDVPDRERLGGLINLGDLTPEERGALAAFDGQSDLAAVARVAGVHVTDMLPLAWGLCVLGLATARRTDTEVPDEGSALVGETDLAIDRERVRARWALVDEADYFALLGVRRDATAFEIRRAYQSARRDFAPDGFPTDLRRELAQELDDIAHVLDEAFRVLRDDRLRLTYLANLVE
jgi:DNA-binding NarL/FixJ family response regulator